jgi:hypothetical protein
MSVRIGPRGGEVYIDAHVPLFAEGAIYVISLRLRARGLPFIFPLDGLLPGRIRAAGCGPFITGRCWRRQVAAGEYQDGKDGSSYAWRKIPNVRTVWIHLKPPLDAIPPANRTESTQALRTDPPNRTPREDNLRMYKSSILLTSPNYNKQFFPEQINYSWMKAGMLP